MSKLHKDLYEFFTQFNSINYIKNEIVVRTDDKPLYIYYIERGFVRQVATAMNGDELTMHIFAPDSFFYVPWIFEVSQNRYDFVTLSPTTLRRAPLKDVHAFLDAHPEIIQDLLVRVYRGMNTTLLRMESMAFGNSQAKVASILLLSARRFGAKVDGKTMIQFPLTHRLIATMAGLARETVSAEMSKLKQEGIIDNYRRFLRLKDVETLQNMSNMGAEVFDEDYE